MQFVPPYAPTEGRAVWAMSVLLLHGMKYSPSWFSYGKKISPGKETLSRLFFPLFCSAKILVPYSSKHHTAN